MNANPEPGLLFSMLSFPFGLWKTPVLVKIISTVMSAELRHCEGVFFPGSLGAVFFSRCCGGIEGIEGQQELALPRTFCLLGCRASQARPMLTDGLLPSPGSLWALDSLRPSFPPAAHYQLLPETNEQDPP